MQSKMMIPLLFFAVMWGHFLSVMPEARYTLLPSMTVFAAATGALIGLPPAWVEIYGSEIKKIHQANGVPLCLGLLLPKTFAMAGRLLPACWGCRAMTVDAISLADFWPLLAIFQVAAAICTVLLRKAGTS